MLSIDTEQTVLRTFNRSTPSTKGGGVAYADRRDLSDRVFRSLRDPGTSLLIVGHSGVGKTSQIVESTERLLGPERIRSPFTRKRTVQASTILADFATALRQAVAEFVATDSLPASVSALEEELADLLNRARLLLIVENLQDIEADSASSRQIWALVKHLGDAQRDFPHAKLALSVAVPYQQLSEIIPSGRFPVEVIEVQPWSSGKLSEILYDGATKCGLSFLDVVVHEIVSLSCGIPAVVHVLAREAALQAISSGLRQRNVVTRQDLDDVVTPLRIRRLTSSLRPGFDYLSRLEGGTPCERAVVATAGILGDMFSVDSVASLLKPFWHQDEVETALNSQSSRNDAFIGRLAYKDRYYSRDRLASAAALLHLRLASRSPSAESDNSGRLYDLITNANIDANSEETEVMKDHSTYVHDGNAPSKKITVLFLGANPKDTTKLRLDEEVREIDLALRDTIFRDNFELRSHWAVRIADLQGYLLRHKPNIVHFSGHGNKSSELILENEAGKAVSVSTRAIGQLFGLLRDNIRCVVLNSCYSERQARAISEHIECVLGMSNAIGDSSAISFSKSFYRALGYGRSVSNAFELARNAIDLQGLDDTDTPKLILGHGSTGNISFVA